jgi:hypothetical protein
MTSVTPAEQVDSLLSDLDRVEPVSFDLGTPEMLEVNAVHQLVAMGTAVVPHLLERMQGDAPKKRIAYIVLVLSHIGDVRALAPLVSLRALYQQREAKDEWDYAVIGQCNLAIEQLEKKRAG